MDSLDELSKTSNGKPSFFKHVFNFDEQSKAEMSNIIQYAVLAIIPVVLLNKLMQKYVPEADENKGSVEITAEVLAQVVTMFLAMLIIHRIITFVPTYSGDKYGDFSIVNIVLSMLVIILSLQTKLGEKVSILVDRLMELWDGPKSENKNKKKGTGTVTVSQPISQNQMALNQSLNSMGSTSISSLPTQQSPDYNQMYQQDSNPLIGASSPGMTETMGNMEPAPANFGGMSSFGGAGGW
jgi:hypothetical protein